MHRHACMPPISRSEAWSVPFSKCQSNCGLRYIRLLPSHEGCLFRNPIWPLPRNASKVLPVTYLSTMRWRHYSARLWIQLKWVFPFHSVGILCGRGFQAGLLLLAIKIESPSVYINKKSCLQGMCGAAFRLPFTLTYNIPPECKLSTRNPKSTANNTVDSPNT